MMALWSSWPRRSTKVEPSTASPSWPTPSKKPVATTPTSWPTAASRGSMYGAAGWWTCSWARSDTMNEEEWWLTPTQRWRWSSCGLKPERSSLMAKTGAKSPFEGLWHIVTMSGWDEDYFNEEVQAFIEFEANGTGQFQFGYVQGYM